MIHGAIAVVFCVIVWVIPFLNNTLMLLPMAFYVGREFTQAEYRYIETYYGRKRANMPWYGGFLPKAWTLKGLLDWIIPTLLCLGMYLGSRWLA